MVRVSTKFNSTNHPGGGYLSNHTIIKEINKHERILENPSF